MLGLTVAGVGFRKRVRNTDAESSLELLSVSLLDIERNLVEEQLNIGHVSPVFKVMSGLDISIQITTCAKKLNVNMHMHSFEAGLSWLCICK